MVGGEGAAVWQPPPKQGLYDPNNERKDDILSHLSKNLSIFDFKIGQDIQYRYCTALSLKLTTFFCLSLNWPLCDPLCGHYSTGIYF
jgi:hypothetical protein